MYGKRRRRACISQYDILALLWPIVKLVEFQAFWFTFGRFWNFRQFLVTIAFKIFRYVHFQGEFQM